MWKPAPTEGRTLRKCRHQHFYTLPQCGPASSITQKHTPSWDTDPRGTAVLPTTFRVCLRAWTRVRTQCQTHTKPHLPNRATLLLNAANESHQQEKHTLCVCCVGHTHQDACLPASASMKTKQTCPACMPNILHPATAIASEKTAQHKDLPIVSFPAHFSTPKPSSSLHVLRVDGQQQNT